MLDPTPAIQGTMPWRCCVAEMPTCSVGAPAKFGGNALVVRFHCPLKSLTIRSPDLS